MPPPWPPPFGAPAGIAVPAYRPAGWRRFFSWRRRQPLLDRRIMGNARKGLVQTFTNGYTFRPYEN